MSSIQIELINEQTNKIFNDVLYERSYKTITDEMRYKEIKLTKKQKEYAANRLFEMQLDQMFWPDDITLAIDEAIEEIDEN